MRKNQMQLSFLSWNERRFVALMNTIFTLYSIVFRSFRFWTKSIRSVILVEFCQSKKFMLNINCISIIYFMSFILLPYTKCNIFILIAYMQLQSTMAMQIRLNSMIVHKMHVNIKCSLFIFIWYIISIKRKYSLL